MRSDEGARSAPIPVEKETFFVDPRALRAFGGELQDLAGQATDAASYARRWTDIEATGGAVIVRLVEQLYGVREEVETFFNDLALVASASGDEVRGAAMRYRSLDEDAAARTDRAYFS